MLNCGIQDENHEFHESTPDVRRATEGPDRWSRLLGGRFMMRRHSLRVASVQMEHVAADKEANFAKIEQFVTEAAAQDVQLIVFPECCVCGYWFLRHLSVAQVAELAEPIPDGPNTERLIGLARRYGLAVGAGWIERAGEGLFYNSYVVALPDGSFHCHRKLQAFEHPAVRSADRYTVFDLPGGWRAGILICYDCNVIEILDPYGRVLADTARAADMMIRADLDPALLETATGRRWMRARRPELYGPLTIRTGQERDTRELKFPTPPRR
jgi:predicted amidohydrolase